jgi:hypothetical protein
MGFLGFIPRHTLYFYSMLWNLASVYPELILENNLSRLLKADFHSGVGVSVYKELTGLTYHADKIDSTKHSDSLFLFGLAFQYSA